jgi:hypothetical protein
MAFDGGSGACRIGFEPRRRGARISGCYRPL